MLVGNQTKDLALLFILPPISLASWGEKNYNSEFSPPILEVDGVEDGGRKGCNAREMGGEKEQMLENFHSPPISETQEGEQVLGNTSI